MKSLKFLVYGVVLIALFSGCEKEKTTVGTTEFSLNSNVSSLNLPFADDATLKSINKDASLVNTKFARKIAVVELESGFKTTMNWQGAKLSAKPIVIYGNQDSKPKFYEFIVIDQSGKAVGTVTTTARKDIYTTVTHVIPGVRDYSNAISKGTSYQIFEGIYPSNPFVGIPSKSGDVPAGLTDLETGLPPVNIPKTDFQSAINFVSNLSDSDLIKYNITDRSGYIANLTERYKNDTTIASQFWQAMTQIQDSLIAMSDTAIIEKVNSDKGWTSYNDYVIPAFNNNRLQATRWDGWCGPCAIAWIYRGLYSNSYNGTYLPLAGESSFYNGNGRYLDYNSTNTGRYYFNGSSSTNENWVKTTSNAIDGGLYYKIAQQTSMFGWLGFGEGPTYPWQLGNCISSVTGGKYTTSWTLGLFAFGNIQDNHLPVIINVDQYSHYIVAFGTRHARWNWSVGSGWFKITISIPDVFNNWYLVTDNGYKTSGNKYMPYWRYYDMTYCDLYYNIKKN